MKLANYTKEIRAIAAKNNTSRDIAVDMFLNNVKDAGDPTDQYFYHGADELDYAALKPHLAELYDDKAEYLANI